MKIVGSEKNSVIEWPGKLSYVIFLEGCNLKCPFCYVPKLVLERNIALSEAEVLDDIRKRADWIDAVCITGGEPCINKDLPEFLRKIKDASSKPIRIETNGTNPELIEQLINNKLIEGIALDIKNCKEKYFLTCNNKTDVKNIEKTITLIKNSDLDYEFRTTLVPGLHEKQDILKLAEWIYNLGKGKIKSYCLNQFRADLPEEETLNPKFIKKGNYSYEKIKDIKKELEKLNYFEKISFRAE
ncbi:anaerobic ribonucleoside-triphosphate reductase activating protein [Candidatus Woesearchaeota archaeon]|nr:anaerobic ribonucleoside-triphosphate reductase activating protein [Candidatus Woesearchaeota archaeon]